MQTVCIYCEVQICNLVVKIMGLIHFKSPYTRSSSNLELDSWFQEICFLRGPEILMETNNYKISGNLFSKLIIVYLLILRCSDYT